MELQAALAESGSVGMLRERTDLLEAFALDIWANIDWAHGDSDAAGRRIYRAIHLLRSGVVEDSTRLGYVLFTAAKIEGTFSKDNKRRIALNLLSDAKKKLSVDHPLWKRLRLQEAKTYIKAGNRPAAEEILNQLDCDTPQLRAEAALVRSWQFLRDKQHDKAEAQARMILDLQKQVSPRLHAEAVLHLGRALIGATGGKEGIDKLEEAYREAEQNRPKIAALACFELARAYSYQDNPDEALAFWQNANALLDRSKSTFLEEVRDTLANELKFSWSFTVETDHFEDEKRKFGTAFFERLRRIHGDNPKDIADAAGVVVNTAKKWLPPLPGGRRKRGRPKGPR